MSGKKMMKSIMFFVMGIFALIYPYSLNRRLFSFVDKLYSLWILHFIPRADRSVLFERFCDLRGGECMVIGEKTGFGKNCIVNCWTQYHDEKFHPQLSIGKYCHIGEGTHITCAYKITIGNNLLTGRRVSENDTCNYLSLYLCIDSCCLLPVCRRTARGYHGYLPACPAYHRSHL